MLKYALVPLLVALDDTAVAVAAAAGAETADRTNGLEIRPAQISATLSGRRTAENF
jgi:hypothetical protein